MPLWHLLCPERQSKQSALFLITVVTFLKYSLRPPPTADYEAGQSDVIIIVTQITDPISFQQNLSPPASAVSEAGKFVTDDFSLFVLKVGGGSATEAALRCATSVA